MTLLDRSAAPLSYEAVPQRSRYSVRNIWEATGMLFVLVILLVGASLFVPNFTRWRNVTALGVSVATVGMVSCTMLFCLASGDFDLSVGSVAAFCGVLTGILLEHQHLSIPLAVSLAVLAGGVVGFVNGFVIARLGINALITTLATMQIVRGFAYIPLDHGVSIAIGNMTFGRILGTAHPLGLPIPVWFLLAFFVVFGVLLRSTIFGRNTLAIGGNAEAARLAGVNVVRTKIIIFTLQGLVAGFAGVVIAAQNGIGEPGVANGMELQVISACVLGGVSLTGGVGTMFGVVIGVLIMGIVNDAMQLYGIQTYWQLVVSGGILLTAVLIDKLKQIYTA